MHIRNFPERFSLTTMEFTHAVGSLTFLMIPLDSISCSSFWTRSLNAEGSLRGGWTTGVASGLIANLSKRRFHGDGDGRSRFGLGRVLLRMANPIRSRSASRQRRENLYFGVVAKTWVNTAILNLFIIKFLKWNLFLVNSWLFTIVFRLASEI
jgi:hypothetical protein